MNDNGWKRPRVSGKSIPPEKLIELVSSIWDRDAAEEVLNEFVNDKERTKEHEEDT